MYLIATKPIKSKQEALDELKECYGYGWHIYEASNGNWTSALIAMFTIGVTFLSGMYVMLLK